ncbi:MAG: SusD/RagB family nutrient-binding outer membrane lipoprotein [Bacteroidaceae bacterium]|nr:SusD/RagB family nutrient-binding outer membrane lipoprotein [Bacteroidaceae bacterium]
MKKYLMFAGSLLVATMSLQSCLDYDDPGDEMGVGAIMGETTTYIGNVDTIMYHTLPTEEGVKNAIDTLDSFGYFGQSLAGQYNMRGGKEAGMPAAHAYQRQYSLGPDTYAQYFTVPHKDFMYGTLTSTYNVSSDFNGGPLGAYTMAKNAIMPLLHHPMVDSIPEIKAINLLYYCVIAQEQADLSGPFTYLEDKQNSETPYEYNDLKTIYYGIVENLDTIVACLENYETRPDWYKEQISNVLVAYHQTNRSMITGDMSMKTYIMLANSLKLRMAMHIVKVEPETAKRWAEEAVAGGVVETVDDQQGLYPMLSGFTHPLMDIANSWGDLRLCASFVSILKSLDHPYTKYLFLPNSGDLTNKKTGEVTPAGTDIFGIRAGLLVGNGQLYQQNQRQGYSTFDNNVMGGMMPPLYFVKLAEVDFLRAEGALRGWNMGGTAQYFYERGIRNAYLEDPMQAQFGSPYMSLVDAYMEQERPVEYVNVDPMGDGEPWPSVTTIGVKWNDADDNETKLEKIITQKYIALFPLSTEAWAEMRRTGYPKVFSVLNTDDGDGSIPQGKAGQWDPNSIIRRIPWVPIDPQAVQMVENSGIPALGGPDELATRLWWDVDKPNF